MPDRYDPMDEELSGRGPYSADPPPSEPQKAVCDDDGACLDVDHAGVTVEKDDTPGGTGWS